MIAEQRALVHHGVPRPIAVAGTIAIAGTFLLVTLVAGAVHARSMRAASLVCETGTPALGGWAEPDTCEGASDGDNFAKHDPQHLLDPWPSAFAAAATIGAAGVISLWSAARLNQTNLLRAFLTLGTALMGLLVLSAVVYRGLLVPG